MALRERVEAVRQEHDELEREYKQLTAKPVRPCPSLSLSSPRSSL